MIEKNSNITLCMSGMTVNLPRDDDKEIQSVPGICEVCAGAVRAHRDHFNDHFQREECKYEVVENLRKKSRKC